MKTTEGINRQQYARPYMIAVIMAGVPVMLYSCYQLLGQSLGLPYWLLVGVTVIIGSRITVRFFRFDSCISVSDIFVFLSLMLFDGEAAILLAALDGFISSLR